MRVVGSFLLKLVVFSLTVWSVLSHQGEHGGHHEHGGAGPLTEKTFHHSSKDDASHQKEHVSQMFGKDGRRHWESQVKEQTGVETDFSRLSETAMMVHFFQLHDFDKNKKLDGLELISAMTSYYDHGLKVHGQGEHLGLGSSHLLLQEEVESIVDRTLQESDVNGDGYVTFVEMMSKQDGLWRSLDQVDDIDNDSGGSDYDYIDEDPPAELLADS